jgi:hypothetical protein
MGFWAATRNLSLLMPLSGDQALAAARMALAELDWPAEENVPGTLVATEDFARLHCHCQPISVKIEVDESGDQESTLSMRMSVPGRGPIASQHLESQSGVLIRRILAQEIEVPTDAAAKHDR